MQAAANSGQAQYRLLKRKLVDASNQCPPRKRKRRTRGHRTSGLEDSLEDPETEEAKANAAGRKFVILHGLWLDFPPDVIFGAELDDDFEEEHRFESRRNRIQGQLHEIRDCLPDSLLDFMQSPWLHHAVRLTNYMRMPNLLTRSHSLPMV